MNKKKLLTTYGYAKMHGLSPDTVRRHCRLGTLDCMTVPVARGMYLIHPAAVIVRAKRGRKKGWRKNK